MRRRTHGTTHQDPSQVTLIVLLRVALRAIKRARGNLCTLVCPVLAVLLLGQAFPLAAQEDYQTLYGDRCPVPVPARELPAADSELHEAHQFATGKGMRVAVIDTGVAAHPRLGELIDGGDYLLAEPGGAFRDCDGHGTIVAGIIAARPDPRQDDLRGVAPEAQIISIRQSSGVLQAIPPTDEFGNPIPNDGSQEARSAGNLQNLTDAIHTAIDLEADIISLSVVSCIPREIASQLDTQPLEAALNRAEEAGTVVVAAAGNKGGSCDDNAVVFPGHFDTVVTVSALSEQGDIAEYSMPSDKLLVSAAGKTPVGLSPSGEGWSKALKSPANGGAQVFEGTSFATPVVSGVVALLKERYPQLTPSQIRNLLTDAVDPATGSVNPRQVLTHVPGKPATFHQAAIPSLPPPSGVQGRFTTAIITLVGLSIGASITHTVVKRRLRTR